MIAQAFEGGKYIESIDKFPNEFTTEILGRGYMCSVTYM